MFGKVKCLACKRREKKHRATTLNLKTADGIVVRYVCEKCAEVIRQSIEDELTDGNNTVYPS